ncbi:MAG: flagellar biosynthesis regulator FlaF [Pseudomonadota bacterium]
MYAQQNQAAGAYQAQLKESLSPRNVEYRVFSQVTSKLEKAYNSDPIDKIELAKALGDNTLLWNALLADVISEGNLLPDQLKAQIIYLAKYTSHHTALIRKEEADPKALIDINKMIMEGLATTPPSPEDFEEEMIEKNVSPADNSLVSGA